MLGRALLLLALVGLASGMGAFFLNDVDPREADAFSGFGYLSYPIFLLIFLN